MSVPASSEPRGEPSADLVAWVDASRFLVHEAGLLDAGDYQGWLGLLCADITYRAPVRSTRYGRASDEFSRTSFHFDEDFFSLSMRVKRLYTKFAWAEDPPSRSRHFVSNISVAGPEASGELRVTSALLLYRSRLDEAAGETLTGERRDVLRYTGSGLKLAGREILLDQTTLPVSAVTTFL
jgi:3-phenylpropionate/cinnamic acid dioxygenase small subunit